ncbi:MAG: DUF998 domain-containing protein [Actinomycetota bacterium]|nr:DUF998 domain-containing protein [Actinomycetota bacterium]
MLGPVWFVSSWTIAGAVRAGYDPVEDAISRLAEIDAPHRWLVSSGMVAFGICALAFSSAWKDDHPGGAGALAAAGLTSLGVAAFPCTEGCPGPGEFTDTAHGVVAGAHYFSFALAAVLSAWEAGKLGRVRYARWSRLAAGAGGVFLLLHVTGLGPNGLFQRLGLTTLDAWLAGSALSALRPRARALGE